MTKLKVRELAEARGIPNPLALSKQGGLAYAMCHKLWNDQQTRIDLATIDRLCDLLACSPGELFRRDSPAASLRVSQSAEHVPRRMTPRPLRSRQWID
jgi:DNA-binding Xre family transcriptional regulator